MSLLKNALLGSAAAAMMLPACGAIAATTPTNGILTINNTTASQIEVSCPNKLRTIPIPANNKLVVWYGGNPASAPNFVTLWLALNMNLQGQCTFSVDGKQIGAADITLSGKGSGVLAPEVASADIAVKAVAGSGFKVDPASASGNEDNFTISNG